MISETSPAMFSKASRHGITIRAMRDEERRTRSQVRGTPLVIEGRDGTSLATLGSFLDDHSDELLKSITQHGAVLFRGFPVRTPSDFENVCLRIRGLEGIHDVFMSEPGRTLVEGTRHVLHTNTMYKTGGSLNPFAFHTENFYVPDVPRYISFFCRKPSWLGGETGLIDMTALYAELSETVQEALCKRSYLAARIPATRIQQRYDLTEEEFLALFDTKDFTIEKAGNSWDLLVYKPCVLVHPETGLPALQVNLAGELNSRGLERKALWEFRHDFAGPQWLAHRMYWRYPAMAWLVGVLSAPLESTKRAFRLRGRARVASFAPPSVRLAECFGPSDIEHLAKLMRRHYVSFRWQEGDVLVADNLRMAHAGMPGMGERDLNAIICNRVVLPCHVNAPGCFVVPDRATTSIGSTLMSRSHRGPDRP